MRLGGGEYDPGGWCEIDARHAFLESAEDVAPHVLQDLKEKVLPEYIRTLPSSWLSAQHDPRHQSIKESLLAWAAKFNVLHDWILKAAFRTMEFWQNTPGFADYDPLIWAPKAKVYWPGTVTPQEPVHYFHRWRPAEEPRDIYKKRMIAHLEAYLDEMESFAQERGLEKTKVIKSAEPFTWLAMWWFCDYSTFQELADDVYVTRQTVTLAIQRAAEKCGLPAPKGEAGRPGSAGKPAKK